MLSSWSFRVSYLCVWKQDLSPGGWCSPDVQHKSLQSLCHVSHFNSKLRNWVWSISCALHPPNKKMEHTSIYWAKMLSQSELTSKHYWAVWGKHHCWVSCFIAFMWNLDHSTFVLGAATFLKPSKFWEMNLLVHSCSSTFKCTKFSMTMVKFTEVLLFWHLCNCSTDFQPNVFDSSWQLFSSCSNWSLSAPPLRFCLTHWPHWDWFDKLLFECHQHVFHSSVLIWTGIGLMYLADRGGACGETQIERES